MPKGPKNKAIETKMGKKKGYTPQEKEILKQERSFVADRARRVKKGGFKSESDYFKNANPFKNYD